MTDSRGNLFITKRTIEINNKLYYLDSELNDFIIVRQRDFTLYHAFNKDYTLFKSGFNSLPLLLNDMAHALDIDVSQLQEQRIKSIQIFQ